MANSDSKVQTQSAPSPIPTLDEIKRLKSLQDVDLGIFTLSDSTASPINDLKAILKTETK